MKVTVDFHRGVLARLARAPAVDNNVPQSVAANDFSEYDRSTISLLRRTLRVSFSGACKTQADLMSAFGGTAVQVSRSSVSQICV